MIRTFWLQWDDDVSGESGTGKVAEGVQWSNGRVAVKWVGNIGSVISYDSIDHVRQIHGHDGSTHIMWDDEDSSSERQHETPTQPAVFQVVDALGALVLPLREWLDSNADDAPTVERIEATTTALRAGLTAYDLITNREAKRARHAATEADDV